MQGRTYHRSNSCIRGPDISAIFFELLTLSARSCNGFYADRHPRWPPPWVHRHPSVCHLPSGHQHDGRRRGGDVRQRVRGRGRHRGGRGSALALGEAPTSSAPPIDPLIFFSLSSRPRTRDRDPTLVALHAVIHLIQVPLPPALIAVNTIF